jgi:hypothetical protein
MEDDVAGHLGANLVLPKSCMKPALPEKSTLVRLWCGDAQLLRGPIVLGIREVSRSIDLEVLPQALEHSGQTQIVPRRARDGRL